MRRAKCHSRSRRLRPTGVTLIELVVALGIAGILGTIAWNSWTKHAENKEVSAAQADISDIAMRIRLYEIEYNNPPMNLQQVGAHLLRDPWGNSYRYLNVNDPAPGTKGKRRKDHNLVPINSDYDLYSMGPDGDSKAPLTAKASRDDIIRAHDGGFIGSAENF